MIDTKTYGPWALITGGSDGVGEAFARLLAGAGIDLVLVARREGPLEALAEELRSGCGVEVRTLSLDLSREDMLAQIRGVTDALEVGLVICNAAATFGSGPLLGWDLDQALRTIRGNAFTHTALSHHFGQGMAARGRGGIMLIGSMAGNAGGATMVLYSAVKAFAQIFAEGLWAELEPLGVDVSYVVLGATDTPSRRAKGYAQGPDVADPAEVARFALTNIKQGPVLVPDHMAQGFQMFQSMPRRRAAEAMRAMLTGFAPETGKAGD